MDAKLSGKYPLSNTLLSTYLRSRLSPLLVLATDLRLNSTLAHAQEKLLPQLVNSVAQPHHVTLRSKPGPVDLYVKFITGTFLLIIDSV